MGGHDHHHHHDPYKVPDYKIYKVADAPQLVEVEKSLARQGLKDPWLRNEVWRYGKGMGTHSGRLLKMFRGLPLGIALVVATVAAEKAMGVDWHNPRGLEKYNHHGGHGDHAEGAHH